MLLFGRVDRASGMVWVGIKEIRVPGDGREEGREIEVTWVPVELVEVFLAEKGLGVVWRREVCVAEGGLSEELVRAEWVRLFGGS